MNEIIEKIKPIPPFNEHEMKSESATAIKEARNPVTKEPLNATEAAFHFAEVKAQMRQYLLRGNLAWESHVADIYCYETCRTCAAGEEFANPDNIKALPWLGIGEDEHCRDCGAFAMFHSHSYKVVERKSLPQLMRDIAAVDEAYSSHTFMSVNQTEKNRQYFGRLLAAINACDPNHRPTRYQDCSDRRHRDELFERLIELATHEYDGDKAKALEVYGNVSREIDDLYIFIYELKEKINAAEKCSTQ